MFTGAQLLYIDEVLGVSAGHFHGAANTTTPILVLTGALNPTERELLNKILYSVKLPPFTIEERDDSTTLGEHVLRFSGQEPGRSGSDWHFPKIAEMVGASAEISLRKKQTWNLLQELAKEFAR